MGSHACMRAHTYTQVSKSNTLFIKNRKLGILTVVQQLGAPVEKSWAD